MAKHKCSGWRSFGNFCVGIATVVSAAVSVVMMYSLIQQWKSTEVAIASLSRQDEQNQLARDTLIDSREQHEESREQHAIELKVAHLPYVAIPTIRTTIPFYVASGKPEIINNDSKWLNPSFIVNYGNGAAIDVRVSWENVRVNKGSILTNGCEDALVSPTNLLPGEAGKITKLPCYITENLLTEGLVVEGEVCVTWRDVREMLDEEEVLSGMERQRFSMSIAESEEGHYAAIFDFRPPMEEHLAPVPE